MRCRLSKIEVERVDQRRIERVEVFGAIERHPVNPVVVFDQQRISHVMLLRIQQIAVLVAAPSPLVGEGIADAGNKLAAVRGCFSVYIC